MPGMAWGEAIKAKMKMSNRHKQAIRQGRVGLPRQPIRQNRKVNLCLMDMSDQRLGIEGFGVFEIRHGFNSNRGR